MTEKKYPRTNTLWAERATNLSWALLLQDSEASRREARPLLDQATSDFRASANIMDSVGQAFLLRGQLDLLEGQRAEAQADLGEALRRLQHEPEQNPAALAKAQALLRRLDKA
ncbi:hypothetical protein [Nevskia soli]|uniref:hypothetical protein n=1 Tax=Nevskia soli TaxID=418856 RepID=UPI0004A6F350|nr:hypothetical protein [Nevskia soli]